MIHASECKISEVVFTHVDPKTGENTHFNITRLLAWIERNSAKLKLHEVPIQSHVGMAYVQSRGIEWDRIERLTAEIAERPLIHLLWPDGTSLLVDGNHRYVWRWLHKLPTFRSYLLLPKQWKPFVIVGAPSVTAEELLSSDSHTKHFDPVGFKRDPQGDSASDVGNTGGKNVTT